MRRLIHIALITLGLMALLAAGLVYQAEHTEHPAGSPPVRLHKVSIPLTSVGQQQQLRHEVPPSAAKHGGADTVVALLSERSADPFTMLGVTWASGLTPEHVYVEAKWHARGQWSSWTALDIEPDAAQIGRPGTEPLWVGGNGVADAAAVRVTSTAGA
jgi:hypothetical protein